MTKTERVRAVLSVCGACCEAVGEEMRTRTERVEELWFEIDDLVDAMGRAETVGDHDVVRMSLQSILRLLGHLEREVPE